MWSKLVFFLLLLVLKFVLMTGAKFCAHDCFLLVLNFVLMIVVLLVLSFVPMIAMSHMPHTLLANSTENDPGASLQPQLACSLSGYFGLAKQ